MSTGLKPSTQAAKITQTMQAYTYYLEGMNKVEAAKKAGITVDVFNYWIEKIDIGEMLDQYQSSFMAIQRQRLAKVARAEGELLDHLINIMLLDQNANDILKILEYLGKQRKELEGKLGANTEKNDADTFLETNEILSGPNVRVEASKMSTVLEGSRTSDVSLHVSPDGGVDIRVPRPPTIIDMEARDMDSLDTSE